MRLNCEGDVDLSVHGGEGSTLEVEYEGEMGQFSGSVETLKVEDYRPGFVDWIWNVLTPEEAKLEVAVNEDDGTIELDHGG